MDWHERPEVKKGDTAEKVVKAWIQEGLPEVSIYPAPDAPHRVDAILLNQRIGRAVWLEIKGRSAPRAAYPDFGLSERDYANYKALSSTSGLPLLLCFVEIAQALVHYHWFSWLDEPCVLTRMDTGRVLAYPRREGGFVYFTTRKMVTALIPIHVLIKTLALPCANSRVREGEITFDTLHLWQDPQTGQWSWAGSTND